MQKECNAPTLYSQQESKLPVNGTDHTGHEKAARKIDFIIYHIT